MVYKWFHIEGEIIVVIIDVAILALILWCSYKNLYTEIITKVKVEIINKRRCIIGYLIAEKNKQRRKYRQRYNYSA